MPGAVNGGRVPGELSLVLAQAAVSAVESADGYAGGVYLRSGNPELLRLAVLAGLPGRLFRPWWRMHVNRPFPVCESYRSYRSILLPDAEEAMRRFPQLMAGLPFPFGSLFVPIGGSHQKFGVLAVLRPATPGRPVSPAHRHSLQQVARQLGSDLAELAGEGTQVVWDGEPVPVQLPPRPSHHRSGSDTSSGTSTPAPSKPTRSCARSSPRSPHSSGAPSTR